MKLYEGWVQSDEDGRAVFCDRYDPFPISGLIVIAIFHDLPVVAWKNRFTTEGRFDLDRLIDEIEAVIGESEAVERAATQELHDGMKVILFN